MSNNTGSNNTALGYNAGPDSNSTNLDYATAIGAGAVVSASNSLVLGGPLGSSSMVKVGIGTATPSHVFTIAQGAGKAIGDGWMTYSSRRWKTNIQTLADALTKVEQLRGVSYVLKDSGKREIGVVAEEVGKVVPEVVTYEKNGQDAQGVDYSRLTALLIEAVKQQQRQIVAQRKQIALQQSQIRQQQRLTNAEELEIGAQRQLMNTQQREIVDLNRKVGVLESTLPNGHEQTTVALTSR